MTTVGVIGAGGKMGTLACQAVEAAEGLEMAARVSRGDALDRLAEVDVAIELTHPAVAMDHISWCIERGVHVVVGTSGFTDERLTSLESALNRAEGVGVLVVPNFSVGAVLMMRFAAQAAPFFESVEIVEMHHPD
ncbi:MAG: 4-hydroxy-tetrahydrodipicolinate reductase, partial [Nocardioidaceae bacterium]